MTRRAAWRPALAALGLLVGGAVWAQPQRPFVIAPVIEGLFDCGAPGAGAHAIAANSYCREHGTAARATTALLDALEPGGPQGAVQVGYVLTLQLLALYRQVDGQWQIDASRVERALSLVRDVPRPVVVYLASNHFDSAGPVTDTLLGDPRNLMLLANGKPPLSDYFGYRVVPYTLRTDEALPVNRLRFDALRHVAQRLQQLPAAARQRIVAVALGGELHHMFPDFDSGMDRHRGAQVTDYSAASVADFRAWLQARHGTVERLNARTGGRWGAFAEVQPPAGDIFEIPDHARTAHYGAYADGLVPVHGWLWDPQRRIERLELLVNGRSAGVIPRGFNRLDVYRAVDEVLDPNVGFRLDVDVSGWEPGAYALQVVAHSALGRHEVGQRRIHIAGARTSRAASWWQRLSFRVGALLRRKLNPLPSGRAQLDLPLGEQHVVVNPLAREWNAFRAAQVTAFHAKLAEVAAGAGVPPEFLYGHQIVPRVNSSWNAELFAVDGSLDAGQAWKPGFNTYGGAAGGEWTRRLVRSLGSVDYGIPEFHPQQWKRPHVHRDALLMHQSLGARFVSPYYMSIASDRAEQSGAPVKALEIRPNNPRDGSDQLYRAIREVAAR